MLGGKEFVLLMKMLWKRMFCFAKSLTSWIGGQDGEIVIIVLFLYLLKRRRRKKGGRIGIVRFLMNFSNGRADSVWCR